MLNRCSLHFVLGCLLLSLIWIFGGCRTVTPAAPAKPKKPTAEAQAAAARAAAQGAFEELDNPNKPAATQPASPAQPAPRTENPPAAVQPQAPASKEVSGRKQDWIDGTSRNYPALQYLTGVGTGPDRVQAEDNARTELAKIFVSHVDSSTKIIQEYVQRVSQGKSEEDSRIRVRDLVKVSTQKVLSGVRIAEIYHQTQPQPLYYALAVLDRSQAMTTLKEKLIRLDREIADLMQQEAAEKKNLQKIKIITAAMETHLQRQTQEAELTVVDPSGKGMAPAITFEEIKRRLNDILSKKFRIHVAVTGDRADELKTGLSEGLTREGFVLTDNIKAAQVAVKGRVTISPLDRPDDKWKYVHWKTAFELVDLSDQSIFGTVRDSGREGHLNLAQADNRAVLKIQKELLPKVSKEVSLYIFGKSKSR